VGATELSFRRVANNIPRGQRDGREHGSRLWRRGIAGGTGREGGLAGAGGREGGGGRRCGLALKKCNVLIYIYKKVYHCNCGGSNNYSIPPGVAVAVHFVVAS
jgi:hypothetical protein